MDKPLHIRNILLKTIPVTDLPYNPDLKQRARKLRQARNLSEVVFWIQVTKSRFHRIDFDRQRVIGNFIVDFYIKRLWLVIEIDGSSHDSKVEYDKARENYLMSLGLKIYRIKVDVMRNITMVMAALEEYIIEEYRVVQEQPPRLHPQADESTSPEEGMRTKKLRQIISPPYK